MAATHESIAVRARDLVKADYVKMQGLAKAVYENPALLAEFERDPAAAALKINGFVVPEGFHIHIADAENKFYPPEDKGIFGDETKGSWDRVEVRAGYKTFSLVACG